MTRNSNKNSPARGERLKSVKDMGKLLLNLKSRGWATTVLRESRVSAGGWPDFFVIGPGGRLGCISVSLEESDGDGGQLWNDAEMPGGLSNMAARLREVRESWRSTHPAEVTEPGLMILCPRFPGAALQRRWPALEQEGVLLAGREFCQGTRITEALERLSEDTPAELTVTLLRAFLAPETVLRPPLSPVERRRQAREHQLSLLPQLLDYDQDHCAKVDLWLSDEGRDAAENFGVRLVTGAAGTGKSVVLVHRAAMLRQFHPEARIAVLTHNQALRADLESRYQRMNGGGGVEFLTFQSWLSRRLCCGKTSWMTARGVVLSPLQLSAPIFWRRSSIGSMIRACKHWRNISRHRGRAAR
jgi:hypothetical protein